MIGYLKGRVLEHDFGRMMVAVGGDGSAVGYAVTVPQGPDYLGFLPGKTVELFIHTHVLEDTLDLYGFATAAEKHLFMTLLSVSGIGPKGATSILSQVDSSELIAAIANQDKAYLGRIKGIGKKTAERLVLELADKLQGFARAARPSGARAAPAGDFETEIGVMSDARSALIGLGYREQEISPVLSRLVAESAQPPQRAEDLVLPALKQLSVSR